MAVNAVPSPSSNSYASNAFAVSLWQVDPHKTDFPTVEADQDSVLISATNQLNDTYQTSWKGKITDAANALYWPRNEVEDPRTGEYYSTDSYPDILQRATAILAYYIYKGNRNSEIKTQPSGPIIKKKLEGVGEFEYAEPTTLSVQRIDSIPEEVKRIISPLIEGGVKVNGFGAYFMRRG